MWFTVIMAFNSFSLGLLGWILSCALWRFVMSCSGRNSIIGLTELTLVCGFEGLVSVCGCLFWLLVLLLTCWAAMAFALCDIRFYLRRFNAAQLALPGD